MSIPTHQPPPRFSAIQKTNLEGAIALGIETIKWLIVVNGVAAGGLLTFYGNVAAKGSQIPVGRGALAIALVLFGLGVVAAVGCSIFAYLSQLAVGTFSGPRHFEIPFRYVAIGFGAVSAVLFLVGVICSALAFLCVCGH